ncbi:MAG TPA: prepilin-type N-terminal cleavage/methylation domain-containing protein [Syntrophomonadaceae bacterium]|jgi:prepilin-type N-terminal cleavage/methylation domain-containing protein|nr:prepilin-type N-terminal cleavage/methylation domain-containing protein [Syntrophomonadaceae bacterium]HHW28251.1 prepilin-type N-terminal cleavage/methylation domain-containing protein [Syntrophomonadaceae bacterium]
MGRKRRTCPFKWIKSTEGFTLVEVLVSIAILTIIVVALLLLFNQSLITVIKSGNKAVNIYEGQTKLESELAEGVTAEDYTLIMNFDGEEIKIKGKIITENGLTVFIPSSKNEPTEEP